MIYKISFNVDTPIITSTDIHLDGIFYSVSPASHNKQYFVDRFTKDSQLGILPIPIDCVKNNGIFVYCCSSADYIDATLICDNSTKRRDGVDYMYYHKQQTPRKGVNKDCMLKLYGVLCSRVEFLCSSSNRSELERYARRVKNIGGMRKQGYGHVTSFEISEMPEMTWQDVIICRGRATRIIPAELLESPAEKTIRYRPPYWVPNGAVQCAVTGDPAIISKSAFLNEFRRGR